MAVPAGPTRPARDACASAERWPRLPSAPRTAPGGPGAPEGGRGRRASAALGTMGARQKRNGSQARKQADCHVALWRPASVPLTVPSATCVGLTKDGSRGPSSHGSVKERRLGERCSEGRAQGAIVGGWGWSEVYRPGGNDFFGGPGVCEVAASEMTRRSSWERWVPGRGSCLCFSLPQHPQKARLLHCLTQGER